MARLYSTLFIGATGVGISAGYVVPADFRAVVRSIAVFFPEGADDTAAALYDVSTSTYVFYRLQLDPFEYVNEGMHQVFNPGAEFEAQSSGPGTVSFRVSGYLLSLP